MYLIYVSNHFVQSQEEHCFADLTSTNELGVTTQKQLKMKLSGIATFARGAAAQEGIRSIGRHLGRYPGRYLGKYLRGYLGKYLGRYPGRSPGKYLGDIYDCKIHRIALCSLSAHANVSYTSNVCEQFHQHAL